MTLLALRREGKNDAGRGHPPSAISAPSEHPALCGGPDRESLQGQCSRRTLSTTEELWRTGRAKSKKKLSEQEIWVQHISKWRCAAGKGQENGKSSEREKARSWTRTASQFLLSPDKLMEMWEKKGLCHLKTNRSFLFWLVIELTKPTQALQNKSTGQVFTLHDNHNTLGACHLRGITEGAPGATLGMWQ